MPDSPCPPSVVRVKDIMTPDVLTIHPDTTVDHAVGLLVQHGISGLPVADSNGRLVGILTDYVLLNLMDQTEFRTAKVSMVMSGDVICVDEEMPIVEVAQILLDNRIRRVPVLRDGQIVGVISREDLMRCAQETSRKAPFLPAPAPTDVPSPRHPDRPRVLVVDDSAVAHAVIRDALCGPRYALEFAFTGEDALMRVGQEPPDLILLARVMPGLDGLDVLRRLRENPRTSEVSVIMVTACNRPAHAAEAIESGAIDYIHKPFSKLDLQARVAAAIRTFRSQRELRAERVKARAANEAKSEFLASMSHEIRTPMTAILGFADMLLAEESLKQWSPRQVEAIQTIKRNGGHLLDLINEILDLSKIEAGKLGVDLAPCSPSEIVSDAVTTMKAKADEKGLALEVEHEGAVPRKILSDAARLRQILINLLGNAVKFTTSGGIRVVTRLLDEDSSAPRMQFQVIDTGIGMTAEQSSGIFKPFAQANSEIESQFGGTGLGLAISQRLAEMLGGALSVDSVQGAGSTFTLEVASGSLEGVRLLNRVADTPVEPEAVQDDQEMDLAGARVLLAEDSSDNQRLISFLLEKAGCHVRVADNGEDAAEQAVAAQHENTPYHVILMDMHMPVLNGYEATKRLRAEGYTGPIIALTANAMSGDRKRCLEVGCDDYTTKPIHRQELLSIVAKYAKRNAAPA